MFRNYAPNLVRQVKTQNYNFEDRISDYKGRFFSFVLIEVNYNLLINKIIKSYLDYNEPKNSTFVVYYLIIKVRILSFKLTQTKLEV